MRSSAFLVLVPLLAGCGLLGGNKDWKAVETTPGTTGSDHAPSQPRNYAARAAKDVQIVAKAPAGAELLSEDVEGREQTGRSASDELRDAAAKLGADCVVVTNRATFATDVRMGAKQWEVLRGAAYRRSSK
jgi:nucleotide-binding universal stress UspA family protein